MLDEATPPAPQPGTEVSLERALSAAEGGRAWTRRALILLVLLGAIAGGVVWRIKTRPPPPARYVLAPVTTGDVVESVQSTGAVQPLTQVQVGAQISGRIAKVFVDFNSDREEGRRARRDRSDAARRDGRAEPRAARRGEAQERTHARRCSTTSGRARSRENACAPRTWRARPTSIRRGASATSRRPISRPRRRRSSRSRRSSATRAPTSTYTRIYSPIDGVVVSRNIDPGQTVAASFQAPVLFVIAQDLRKMRVLADVDEADVGKLKEGMAADATVDAFPGETFHGIVQPGALQPEQRAGRRHVLGGHRRRRTRT